MKRYLQKRRKNNFIFNAYSPKFFPPLRFTKTSDDAKALSKTLQARFPSRGGQTDNARIDLPEIPHIGRWAANICGIIKSSEIDRLYLPRVVKSQSRFRKNLWISKNLKSKIINTGNFIFMIRIIIWGAFIYGQKGMIRFIFWKLPKKKDKNFFKLPKM